MIDFKPDRLGHCCFLTEEQIQQVHDLNIPVEICPTSNLAVVKQAAGIAKFMPHLQSFYAKGSNIAVCCDDTMLFSTHHSTEYFEFANAVDAGPKEFEAILLKNVDAIFDESAKDWLRETLAAYRWE
jgi:adenosine deaminase